ncbi:hypothetical protein LINGRAHAP2_LOCUS13944 [Linum grandiflorum]
MAALSTATTSNKTDRGPFVLYVVSNADNHTLGGARFNTQIGADTAAQTMHAATTFTWYVFNQTDNPLERKNVSIISLVIQDMPENSPPSYTKNISINLNSNFIGNYTANLRRQFSGIIYQEVAGIWQWNGDGKAPRGLVTGIAHYVRLQARYGTVEKKVRPGDGNRWDQGDGVTCRFLEYCNQMRKGFVRDLNRKMRYGYTNAYFFDLLGKSVDQVWKDYKAKYPRKHY